MTTGHSGIRGAGDCFPKKAVELFLGKPRRRERSSVNRTGPEGMGEITGGSNAQIHRGDDHMDPV